MRIHLIAVVTLSTIMMYLLNSATQENTAGSNSSDRQSNQDYDFFMTHVDSTHFDLDGQRSYRIQARRLTHYPDPDFTTIETPTFVIYQNENSPWIISAENGRIENDAELMLVKVELSNNVVIRGIDPDGHELNIYTEFLTVYPETKNLSTDREVLLESPGSEFTSIGLTADLSLNQIKLLSNVRGHYE